MTCIHSISFCRLFRKLAVAAVLAVVITTSAQTNFTPTVTQWSSTTNSYWQALYIDPAIYDTPYCISLFNPQNGEDGKRVWSQTQSVFFYGLGVFGILLALPEEFTGWDKSNTNIARQWAENVKQGAVWDRDAWYVNYIGHPYFGGVYYQIARKSGYRQWDSFIYSVLMSTFYWEYGVEAFAEEPSIQDLVVHPVMGWVYGEWAYQTEIKIRRAGGEVAGSKTLGSMALIALDPIDSLGRGINKLTGTSMFHAGSGYLTYTASPTETKTDHRLYLNMSVPLGGSNPPEEKKIYPTESRTDPVDTGIIGISVGEGHTFLDDQWGVKNGPYTKTTLGLYFTPRLSSRVSYAKGELVERATGGSITYENYSLDTQCYLNTRQPLRAFVTAGFGEQMWEKDRDQKTFQWNAGLGLHYHLHRKWAIQADWTQFYSPSKKTYDHNVNAGLVYRFGRGEHDDW
jgi:hypothetical protein